MDPQLQYELGVESSGETLSADELELRAQGHVGELPRQFGLLSTLSLGFSITNSWVSLRLPGRVFGEVVTNEFLRLATPPSSAYRFSVVEALWSSSACW